MKHFSTLDDEQPACLLDHYFPSILQYGNCIDILASLDPQTSLVDSNKQIIFTNRDKTTLLANLKLCSIELKSDCLMLQEPEAEEYDDLMMVETKPLSITLHSSGEWEVNAQSPAASSSASGFSLRRFGMKPNKLFLCHIVLHIDHYEIFFNDYRMNLSEHLVPLGMIQHLLIIGKASIRAVIYGRKDVVDTASALLVQRLQHSSTKLTWIYDYQLMEGHELPSGMVRVLNKNGDEKEEDPLRDFNVRTESDLHNFKRNVALPMPSMEDSARAMKVREMRGLCAAEIETNHVLTVPQELESQSDEMEALCSFRHDSLSALVALEQGIMVNDSLCDEEIVDEMIHMSHGLSMMYLEAADSQFEHCQSLGSNFSIVTNEQQHSGSESKVLCFDTAPIRMDRVENVTYTAPTRSSLLMADKAVLWNVEQRIATSWLDLELGHDLFLYLQYTYSHAYSRTTTSHALFNNISMNGPASLESLVSVSPMLDISSTDISSEGSLREAALLHHSSVPDLGQIRRTASNWLKRKLKAAKSILNN
ncbi:hypothetical protein Ciccas_011091 [Cichlidogyrus casuarinus]|uniref:Uncharacterized protein n=1 Tax=Cichlidogyrus casuarinus TaxID=1844966 RepID=A0ABD2PUB2_9PLAT